MLKKDPGFHEKMHEIFSRTTTHYLLLILVGGLLFIPFLGSVHLYDWDELNFAEASREMLDTGNFMRVTINFQPFWEKPPLFFWLQAGSMKLFGVNEFSARLVNAIIGIITLLVVYRIGRRYFNSTFGLLWALTFAGSFLPHVFFKSGIIDPVFNLFIFLGIVYLAAIVRSTDSKRRSVNALVSGFFIGLAILTKGPVALIVITLVVVSYLSITRFKSFVSFREILLFTGAMMSVSLLFYGIETLRNGPWFVTEFIRYQIRLFRTGDAGHGRPFYFHFLVLLFGCFPASFFAIRSFKKDTSFTDSQQLFTAFMKITFWVVLILFSIVKTKTVLYSSMCWYPLTYLGALHMWKLVSGEVRWGRTLHISFIGFTLLVGIAVAVFPFLLKYKELIMPLIKDKFAVACMQKPVSWSGWESLIGIGFLAVSFMAFIFLSKGRMRAGLSALFVASVFCVQFTLIVINPKIEQYTQSDPVAFFKKHSGDDEYVRSLFKSYADLFYGNVRPDDNPSSYDRDWLLTGDIDKPAYFVGRIQQDKRFGSDRFDLETLEKKYGFVYYRRMPKPQTEFAAR